MSQARPLPAVPWGTHRIYPPSPMMLARKTANTGIEVANLSHIGRVRENNEDSYLYWEPPTEDEIRVKGRLAVIADGMGGYEGGQEASRIAAETVREVYASSTQREASAALAEAFAAAHERILLHAAKNPALQGMGTTCTALVIAGLPTQFQLYFAHVGDSRLYLLRDRSLTRLTRDHSYVGRLVESGIVRSEDAENHPQRHILTAALGAGREVPADVSQEPLALQCSDSLILCTDGLWGVVGEPELAAVVNANPPRESCEAIVQMALERGGPDNITVQILRISNCD